MNAEFAAGRLSLKKNGKSRPDALEASLDWAVVAEARGNSRPERC
jgi:hypothetical protein